jgi:hypothetical protein
MSTETRDAIRNVVAVMRGEKRAAPAWLGRVVGGIRRGGQLLAGSKARRIEQNLGRVRQKIDTFKGLRSDTLADADKLLATGQYGGRDMSLRMQNRLQGMLSRSAARYDRMLGGMNSYAARLEPALAAERAAVLKARLLAGGTLAAGGAAYGGYKALDGGDDTDATALQHGPQSKAAEAIEKRAGLFKFLGKAGVLGLAGYGGYKGYQDVKGRLAPPPPPPAPEPSMLDRIKGFAAEHPVGTAAAAVGVPLLAYLGYKAFSGGDDDRKKYYPYG